MPVPSESDRAVVRAEVIQHQPEIGKDGFQERAEVHLRIDDQ